MKEITISDAYITLGQLLKLANVIQSGGEFKFFIQQHSIRVNQQPEERRGKKIYPSDIVQIEGVEEIKVVK